MTLPKDLFTSLGITLGPIEAEAFEKHFRETLDERVGLAIFDLLDDAHATELIELQAKGDDEAIMTWIKTNVPDYDEIVQDEFDILMGEVAQNANAFAAA